MKFGLKNLDSPVLIFQMEKLDQEYKRANDKLKRRTLEANKLEEELAQLRSPRISKENQQRRHRPSRPEDVRSPTGSGRGARATPFEMPSSESAKNGSSRGGSNRGDRSLSPSGSRRGGNLFQERTDQRGVGYAIKRFFM